MNKKCIHFYKNGEYKIIINCKEQTCWMGVCNDSFIICIMGNLKRYWIPYDMKCFHVSEWLSKLNKEQLKTYLQLQLEGEIYE